MNIFLQLNVNFQVQCQIYLLFLCVVAGGIETTGSPGIELPHQWIPAEQ